jgi:hypothetical protein
MTKKKLTKEIAELEEVIGIARGLLESAESLTEYQEVAGALVGYEEQLEAYREQLQEVQ